MLRGDARYSRHLSKIPSYRQYLRNTRNSPSRHTPSSRCTPPWKFFGYSSLTVLIALYLKSTATKYTHQWTWKASDSHSAKKINEMQQSAEMWLKQYPEIKPHRAHDGFTCDAWNCRTTFDVSSNQWIEPRKEYLVSSDRTKYDEWMNLHKLQNAKLSDTTQECEWIFIGNSITYGFNQYHPNVFNKYFNNGIVYAISGDKIHEVGWRLTNAQGQGFKHMEQCILNGSQQQTSMVLLIGTNDIGSGTSYGVAISDYMALLTQMMGFINDLNRNVTLYVIGIFPRGETYVNFNDRKNAKMKEFEDWNVDNAYFYSVNFINDYLSHFVQSQNQNNIKYVDCNKYLVDSEDVVEFKDNDGRLHEYTTGRMHIDIMDDMLHLTEKGYERWSNCILEETESI